MAALLALKASIAASTQEIAEQADRVRCVMTPPSAPPSSPPHQPPGVHVGPAPPRRMRAQERAAQAAEFKALQDAAINPYEEYRWALCVLGDLLRVPGRRSSWHLLCPAS